MLDFITVTTNISAPKTNPLTSGFPILSLVPKCTSAKSIPKEVTRAATINNPSLISNVPARRSNIEFTINIASPKFGFLKKIQAKKTHACVISHPDKTPNKVGKLHSLGEFLTNFSKLANPGLGTPPNWRGR